jgi:glycerophosphoryl diester phosphodiesterase
VPGRLLCVALALAACKKSREAPEPPTAVELQGHRGARGLAPENTIEGVRAALAIGVDTVEIDVHLSADGIPVVTHDPALAPSLTRDSTGAWITAPIPVRSLTAAELASYDVGAVRPGTKYAARFPRARPIDGAKIPTLDALIADVERLTGGAIRYNIETKLTPEQTDPSPEALVGAVVAVIRAHEIARRVTVQSFDWRALAHVAEVAPEITRACLTTRGARSDTVGVGRLGPSPWTAGLDVDDHGGSVPALVKAAGCAIWSPTAFALHRGEVAKAHALGLRVITWTVNRPEDIDRAIEMGVDGVITDEPDRAREVMARRGLPLPKAYVSADLVR